MTIQKKLAFLNQKHVIKHLHVEYPDDEDEDAAAEQRAEEGEVDLREDREDCEGEEGGAGDDKGQHELLAEAGAVVGDAEDADGEGDEAQPRALRDLVAEPADVCEALDLVGPERVEGGAALRSSNKSNSQGSGAICPPRLSLQSRPVSANLSQSRSASPAERRGS